MHPRSFALLFLFLTVLRLAGQTGLPVITTPMEDRALARDSGPVTIDLRNHFGLSGVTGTVVQFTTVLGTFNVEMLATAAPVSVSNFLSYVNDGSYQNTIFHRSAKLSGTGNGIIQGGANTYALPPGNVATKSPIALEYNLPNARGTLAMARTSAADSATSQWFFNVNDNSTVLGAANGGGYAVFGRVLGTGLTVVDAIAALPIYNIGSGFTEIPLRNIVAGQTAVQLQNFVAITKVATVSILPTAGVTGSVLDFGNGSTNSNPEVVTATIAANELILTPKAGATGVTIITLVAGDAQGNAVTARFRVGIAATGAVALPPVAQSPAIGGNATFGVTVAGGASAYQWLRNGTLITGATGSTHTVTNVQSADAGLYSVIATTPGGTVTSVPAILAPVTTQKVVGTAYELNPNVLHPNGNRYDQLLLTGSAATFTADAGQVTRISYIDLNDDIVQVEFSGAGAVTLVLDAAGGPAAPVNYSQAVNYMKGHGSIYLADTNSTSYVSAFTVGRMTAYDPTGGYNIALPVSDTNRPANNGNAIFKAGTSYDGVADIGLLAITSPNSAFGGILSANAHYWRDKGYTGIYAPGVLISDGRVFLHDLTAFGEASPSLQVGSASNMRITGGNLKQDNNRAVQVGGFTSLLFANGTDSHGNLLSAQANQGRLEENGVDVTAQRVAGGPP